MSKRMQSVDALNEGGVDASDSPVTDNNTTTMTSSSSASKKTLPPKEDMPGILDGEFFEVISVSDKNICTAFCNLCKPKKKTINGSLKGTGNFYDHIKRVHGAFFEQAEKKRFSNNPKRRKTQAHDNSNSNKNSKQQQLHSFLTSGSGRKCCTQAEVLCEVSRLIIEADLPISLVKKESFKRLVDVLTKGNSLKLSTPTVREVNDCNNRRFENMTKNIKDILQNRDYVCTTADLWSKGKKAFLGMTAHCINPITLERESFGLACRRVKFRHTHDVIAKVICAVHTEYNIVKKVRRTVTDNASNFIKAFNEYGSQSDDEGEEDEDDSPKAGQSNAADPVATTSNEDADHGNPAAADTEADVAFSELEVDLSAPEVAMDDFLALPLQLRCCSHTLNLVATSDVEVSDKSRKKNNGPSDIKGLSKYTEIHKRVFGKLSAFWNRLSRSTHASDTCEAICGCQFPVPNATRWNAKFDASRKIIKKKEKLRDLFVVLRLDPLNDEDLAFLEEYVFVMEPLATALDILQGEKTVYLGSVLPTILSIERRLEDMGNLIYCDPLKTLALHGLRRRFESVLNFSSRESDDFLIATVSHPAFKLLYIPQHVKNRAKEMFLAECNRDEPSPINIEIEEEHKPSIIEPADAFFSVLATQSNPTRSQKSTTEEALRFLDNDSTELKILENYPCVKEVFLKFNTPLPSSGPVERLFSTAGRILEPRRSRLGDQRFEQSVLLRMTKDFC